MGEEDQDLLDALDSMRVEHDIPDEDLDAHELYMRKMDAELESMEACEDTDD